MAFWMVLSSVLAIGGIADDLTEKKEVITREESPMRVLFNFEGDGRRWRVIDDGVMGGLSEGTWAVSQGLGVFSGMLSLENNGGFSSVRSDGVGPSCSGVTSFLIRVKGDGRSYQFRVRDSMAFDGASYRMTFDTEAGVWQEIVLPLEGFEASFRGRVLGDYPALAGEKVTTVGFLLADKQPGLFRLEVDWIKVRVRTEAENVPE